MTKQEPNIEQQHQKDFLWQILVPVLVVALILIIAAGFVAVASSGKVSLLADISVIWLIAPMLIVFLIITVVTIVAIYGMVRLLPQVPYYSRRILLYVLITHQKVKTVTDKSVQPFVKVKVYNAEFQALVNSLRSVFRGNN